MDPKKAGTIKKPAKQIKNAASVNSGPKQTKSLRKQSYQLLSGKGKGQREKPAGNREKQPMEKLSEMRSAELNKAKKLLRKEKSERKLADKIVELNLAKDVLAEQSEQLESFFMHTITPLVFLDPDFNFIRVNEAYATACNRNASEFPGHNHFEFYPDAENEAIFKRVVETKKPYQAVAKPFVFPDHPEWGVTYWDWVLFPVLDNKGKVAFLVFSLQEVTERALAEHAIYESEKKYRSLIEQASDGIVIFDRQLNFIDANPMAYQISGLSREKLLRMNMRDVLPEDEYDIIPPLLDRVFAGETVRQEMSMLRKSGKLITIEISANLLEDGNIQTIVRDITDRKEAENRDHFITQLLELFAKKTSREAYLDSVVHLVHEWTGCRHVGIRVVNEESYVPYASYKGFSEEFMRLESMLSLNSDSCACIRVINGKYESQDASALTPNGSFYLSNSIKFMEQLTQPELSRFRGNCMQNGYASLAIIPVRYRNQPLGAIHLADEREDMLPLRAVQFLESMAAPLIGEAIRRFSAEEELTENKASLADAQRLAHLGNWTWNIKTNALHWSDEMYHIFGLARQQFGATYNAFLHSVHPDDRGDVMNAVQEALQRKKPYNIDYSIVLPDGAIRIIHAQGKVTYNEKGEPIRMFGTVQDITGQKQTEEEIRDSREQLRNLYLHLQSVREEERTYIAREIHDEFGTILTALKIDLSWLERQFTEKNGASREKILKDLDLINSAIKTVQRISSELRPGILDHLGLAAAMEWQVKEFCNRAGINWDISIELGDTKPDRDLSTTMFRILQESLTNIARHAEATEVRVSLREEDNILSLEIIDDGKGVTEEQLSDRNSFGLIGMRERAQHLGGDMFIERADGKGTKVLVTIPL
jgi:two-component system, NarL family, sensor histidine kinase UhpB